MSELYITLIIGISALIITGIRFYVFKKNTDSPIKEHDFSKSDSIINEFNREFYDLTEGVDHEFEEIFPTDRSPKQSH